MEYELRKSERARHMRITVRADERVIVTVPKRISLEAGKLFAESKRTWMEGVLRRLRSRKHPALSVPSATQVDYRKRKEEALTLVLQKLDLFNKHYRLTWNNVSIKNTSSRWGSCSKRGNLNFSYRVVYLPEEYVDYLIVHELCHLQEFNHSPAFWKLVSETMPNYVTLRSTIRVM